MSAPFEPFSWKIRSATLTFERPLIMGIVNLTPDSFSDGGKFLKPSDASAETLRLIGDGADIVDLGAESTRPGAQPVSNDEELSRLLPVLRELKGKVEIPISIDTTKFSVARAALREGAHIINDVSGLAQEPELADLVSEYGAGLILMHRRGTPQTMQSMAHYDDVVAEIIGELSQSIRRAESCGVSLDQIVCDPGIGFAKTAEQNFEVIKRLSEFKTLGRPMVVGPSRKSFIGSVTGKDPQNRLMGTVASCVLACERGANILRVHDVKAVKEALLITESIMHYKEGLH